MSIYILQFPDFNREDNKMANKTIYIGVAVVVVIAAALGTYYWMNLMAAPASTPTPPASTQHITIVAKDIKFNATNPTITVKVGSVQITVINQDTAPHNFLIKEIPSASTGLLNPGQSQTITVNFATTGTYNYYCAVHPGQMDGIIKVIS
jgi:plastocyanin